MTEPVIFQNFGTKAELFATALDRVSEQATAHLRALIAEHQQVHDWLRDHLAAEHLDHLHTAPMFGVLFEDAHRLQFEPGVGATLQRSTARVAEGMAVILQRGQAEGSIRWLRFCWSASTRSKACWRRIANRRPRWSWSACGPLATTCIRMCACRFRTAHARLRPWLAGHHPRVRRRVRGSP